MLRNLIILSLSLTLTGCLLTVDSREKSAHSQWTRADVSRIEIGKTDADWVRTAFGSDRRQSSTSDGTEIWRYENVNRTESEVGLFLLFHVDVEKEESETLAIEMRDSIVADYWIESDTDRNR